MDEKTPPRAKGKTDPDWSAEAIALFNSILARHGFTLKDLRASLARRGLDMTYKSLSNKISRGTFSLAFFLEAMDAIDVRSVQLSTDIEERPRKLPSDTTE